MSFATAFPAVLEIEGGYARSLQVILRAEGGYVDDPNDPGGATNQGITQAVYDSWRRGQGLPSRPVLGIDPGEVRQIYLERYWTPARCDELPGPVALVHFDCAVNAGVEQAALTLQRAAGVTADGVIGPVTLAAARARPPLELVDEMMFQRLRYYRAIAIRKRADGRDLRAFLPAWVGRLLDLRYEVRS
jgi:lysozyme family protein